MSVLSDQLADAIEKFHSGTYTEAQLSVALAPILSQMGVDPVVAAKVVKLADNMQIRMLFGAESDLPVTAGVVNLVDAQTGVIRITGETTIITSLGPVPDATSGASSIRYVRVENAQTIAALAGSPTFVAGETLTLQGITGTTWLLRERRDPTGVAYVDKSTAQTAAGKKTWSAAAKFKAGAFMDTGYVWGMSGDEDYRTYIYSPDGTSMALRANGINAVTIDATGTVTTHGQVNTGGSLLAVGGIYPSDGSGLQTARYFTANSSGLNATGADTMYFNVIRPAKASGQVAIALRGGTGGTDWIIHQPSESDNLVFYGNTGERAVLSSTGDLQIGNGGASPQARLHVVGTGSEAELMIGYLGGASNYYSAGTHYFRAGATGGFASIMTVNGAAVSVNVGNLTIAQDGAAFSFYNTGGTTRQGYIQSLGGNLLICVDGGGGYWSINGSTGHLEPNSDATKNFAHPAARINNSYFAVAPTVSSDEKFKIFVGGEMVGANDNCDAHAVEEAEPISDLILDAVGEILPFLYWDRDAHDDPSKGPTKARFHAGYSFQKAEAAFASRGLDVSRFAFWCRDEETRKVSSTRKAMRQKVGPDGKSLFKTVTVLDEAGAPVMRRTPRMRQDGERRELRLVDGKPTLVMVPNMVPVTEAVRVHDEAGNPLDTVITPAQEAYVGEDGKEVAAVEAVIGPWMVEVQLYDEVPETREEPDIEEWDEPCEVDEPTGVFRGGLRYQEFEVYKGAWRDREDARKAQKIAEQGQEIADLKARLTAAGIA